VAAGCFVAPFTAGPVVFGVLLGLGDVGTFRGAGPIVDDQISEVETMVEGG